MAGLLDLFLGSITKGQGTPGIMPGQSGASGQLDQTYFDLGSAPMPEGMGPDGGGTMDQMLVMLGENYGKKLKDGNMQPGMFGGKNYRETSAPDMSQMFANPNALLRAQTQRAQDPINMDPIVQNPYLRSLLGG